MQDRSRIALAHPKWAIFVLLVLPTFAIAQNSQTLLFSAGAYGTSAFVGDVVKLGKTAPVGIGAGCGTTEVGASKAGTVASVNALPLVQTGLINTSAISSSSSASATSNVNQVNLLAGLITADEVMSESTTSERDGTLSSSASGSNFINLVVAGTQITGVPAPNTKIDLLGLGYVVLNEEFRSSETAKAELTVNMIHVYITEKNVLGIDVNTQIIVADAHSGLTKASGPGVLDGAAFGTRVNALGGILKSSPTAPVGVGCLGTEGKTRTNSVVSVNLSPLATSGTITDTAEGNITESLAQSHTTSTVQALNILSGTVTADVILASGAVSTADGSTINFTDGSAFTKLQVAGFPEINADVPANTKLSLAGLGDLWLHRVIRHKNSIEIRMVELQINQENVYGIPLGTDIRVADATASVESNAKP
jgi:hypothetical protein